MKHQLGYSPSGFALGYSAARLLPRGVCQGIGSTLGLAGYLGNKESRLALRRNLKRVTGVNGSSLDRLCRDNFQNFGRMLADYFYCAGIQASKLDQIRNLLGDWHGIEHLSEALALGRGVLLATGHLGNWELGATLLALDGWKVNVVTLPEPASELPRPRDAYRRRIGIRTIEVGTDAFAFVEMMAALRRNEIVCMLVDRPYGNTGIPVDFFGRETCFSAGPALLWEHTAAPVIPAFVLRNGNGRYHAFAQRAVGLETAVDGRESAAANTQRIATVFEAIIRQHPDQWFNYVPIWKNETAPLSLVDGV
jgi:KDO2-lipid IV(A) lauroyltransferase